MSYHNQSRNLVRTHNDSDNESAEAARIPRRRGRRLHRSIRHRSDQFRRNSTGEIVEITIDDVDERFDGADELADDECSDFDPEQEEQLTSSFARVCSFGSEMETLKQNLFDASSDEILAISGAVAETHLSGCNGLSLTPPRNSLIAPGKRSYRNLSASQSISSSSQLGSPYSSGYRLSAKRTCTSDSTSAPFPNSYIFTRGAQQISSSAGILESAKTTENSQTNNQNDWAGNNGSVQMDASPSCQ